jgi:hypothetical protein
LRRRTKKTTSATRARNRSDPPTAPAISGVLSVSVGVALTAVADTDVVVVAATVVDAVVVAVVGVGGLAAVQVATGRLEQRHTEGLVEQSCIQVRIDSATADVRSPSTSR